MSIFQPGIAFLLRTDSYVCSLLLDALFLSSTVNPVRLREYHYDQLILMILSLLASILYLGKVNEHKYETNGFEFYFWSLKSEKLLLRSALLNRDLTLYAQRRGILRFAHFIRCLHFNDLQITVRYINNLIGLVVGLLNLFFKHKTLMFFNAFLFCEDNEWEARMAWRSELYSAGLKHILPVQFLICLQLITLLLILCRRLKNSPRKMEV